MRVYGGEDRADWVDFILVGVFWRLWGTAVACGAGAREVLQPARVIIAAFISAAAMAPQLDARWYILIESLLNEGLRLSE